MLTCSSSIHFCFPLLHPLSLNKILNGFPTAFILKTSLSGWSQSSLYGQAQYSFVFCTVILLFKILQATLALFQFLVLKTFPSKNKTLYMLAPLHDLPLYYYGSKSYSFQILSYMISLKINTHTHPYTLKDAQKKYLWMK